MPDINGQSNSSFANFLKSNFGLGNPGNTIGKTIKKSKSIDNKDADNFIWPKNEPSKLGSILDKHIPDEKYCKPKDDIEEKMVEDWSDYVKVSETINEINEYYHHKKSGNKKISQNIKNKFSPPHFNIYLPVFKASDEIQSAKSETYKRLSAGPLYARVAVAIVVAAILSFFINFYNDGLSNKITATMDNIVSYPFRQVAKSTNTKQYFKIESPQNRLTSPLSIPKKIKSDYIIKNQAKIDNQIKSNVPLTITINDLLGSEAKADAGLAKNMEEDGAIVKYSKKLYDKTSNFLGDLLISMSKKQIQYSEDLNNGLLKLKK